MLAKSLIPSSSLDVTFSLICEPFNNNLDLFDIFLVFYIRMFYICIVLQLMILWTKIESDAFHSFPSGTVWDCQGRPCFLKCYCDFNIFPLSTSNMLVPKWRHGFCPRRFRLGIAINPTKRTNRIRTNTPLFRFGSIEKINFLAQWILLPTLKIRIKFWKLVQGRPHLSDVTPNSNRKLKLLDVYTRYKNNRTWLNEKDLMQQIFYILRFTTTWCGLMGHANSQ